MVRQGLSAAVLLCALAASAAGEGLGRTQFIQAAAAQGDIRIDGKLDEASWAQAPVFDAFLQRFPAAGAPASERTEVRILYDLHRVYFGIIAHDSLPALIDRRLGRRDSVLITDLVQLIIDSTHDHRTAYSFSLSAGGVQGDGLYYDDRTYTADWDGVWDGATGSVADGWVAEFSIPLSLLRFPEAATQTWGFSVRRQIARLNEESESVYNPRDSNANVSGLGHLTGMEGLKPRREIELVPYLATRGELLPQFSDPTRPTPRQLAPTLDVGLDLKAALTSDLALNATISPDFGQVEADQLILNLTTFEAFFPEKRTFFTQGLELFQPLNVAEDSDTVSQALFYSRRIGLGTPILGAAKLTGTLTQGVEVGVLDALVTGPWQPQDEERPDRRWRLYANRPLHLGPNSTLPGSPQPATNFLAAVARGSVGGNSRVGGSFAAATPLEGGCTAELAALSEPPAACLARGGMGAAMDFDLKSASSEYGVLGQVDTSRVTGGPPERTLPDGTLLERGAMGYGGYVRAGKFGGEGQRWDVGYDFASPRLDLNATGFQQTQNQHTAHVALRYTRTSNLDYFKEFSYDIQANTNWTTDGRGLNRGSNVIGWAAVTTPSFDFIGVEGAANWGGYDIRELDGTGIPLQQDLYTHLLTFWKSNGKRLLKFDGYLSLLHHNQGPARGVWGWSGSLRFSLRPHPALETNLNMLGERSGSSPRFYDNLGDNRFLLGNLRSTFLSATLRQSWVIRPNLTLQGYAQLFTAYGVFGPFYEAESDGERTPIRFASMRRVEDPSGSFYDVALNLSAVLRWEYRLGSTLFFVYTRSQQGLLTPDGETSPATLIPQRLFSGPATDAVLVKWSYYWST